jgi:dTDP-4-amino-4,6-dideoxygalactose transaminase
MNEDLLPYSRQKLDEEEIRAVTEVLRSPIISQGTRLEQFEQAFAKNAGVPHAVGLSSGSAALHAMCSAIGLGEGDEVVVPALTFASTATAVLHTGARPVFAEIDPASLCLNPESVRSRLSARTKAILAVDFAGHPAPYGDLRALADRHDLLLLADSAHSVGGAYGEMPIGSIADATAFSFNPVKNMTTAEGGMVTTRLTDVASRIRMFRVHGMTREADLLEKSPPGGWYYEQQFNGFNYKLSELHAALGLVQLSRLGSFNARRAEIARSYLEALEDLPLRLPPQPVDGRHTWHLFVIQVDDPDTRPRLFDFLRTRRIGVQVHYIPVPRHPFFQRLGYTMDGLEETGRYYDRAMSLPVHPAMSDRDLQHVISSLRSFFSGSDR